MFEVWDGKNGLLVVSDLDPLMTYVVDPKWIVSASYPSLDRSGQWVVFTGTSDDGREGIWRCDVNGKNLELLSDSGKRAVFLAHQDVIALINPGEKGEAIVRLAVGERASSRNAASAHFVTTISSSNDGRSLAFQKLEGGKWKLCLVDMETDQVREVDVGEANLSWSVYVR